MTLIISEKDVEGLLDMNEVVVCVEEAFRQAGLGAATNSPRTRSKGQESVLNVMHANLSFLNRGGLKAYMSTGPATKFTVVLIDSSSAVPLAVMGADILGRFRTGAASGVATKFLYGEKSGTLAVMGSGKQALTQALAVRTVMTVDQVRVWSPNRSHREAFTHRLGDEGFRVMSCDSPSLALNGSDVVCSITSSRDPFMTDAMLGSVSHVNICGGNVPEHAEMTTAAVGLFETVVVDDVSQAQVEYGDLIQAVSAGTFSWDKAEELGKVVAGKKGHRGRTLFKSGGVALEDVAVASMLYEKARKSGRAYPNVELV